MGREIGFSCRDVTLTTAEEKQENPPRAGAGLRRFLAATVWQVPNQMEPPRCLTLLQRSLSLRLNKALFVLLYCHTAEVSVTLTVAIYIAI